MKVVRRRLRIAVAAWLLFQVASLSALVPRNCCPAHQAAAARCHESGDSSYCPTRTRTGTPCPMHQNRQSHHDQAEVSEHAGHAQPAHDHATPPPASEDRCALRGTCDAPMTALAVLLSNHGVMPAPVAALPDPRYTSAPLLQHQNLVDYFVIPDGPPPRA